MKTQVILPIMFLAITTLAICSIITPVYAHPPQYGLIKANQRKHIVRNYLFDSSDAVSGWVTFACQSVEGFQYSVAVRDLSPTTTYTVQAVSLATAETPYGPQPTSDGAGVIYPLGILLTNGEGEGEVTGLIPLPATHAVLPFGLYGWDIQVIDTSNNVVLSTLPADPIDFQVFPAWP